MKSKIRDWLGDWAESASAKSLSKHHGLTDPVDFIEGLGIAIAAHSIQAAGGLARITEIQHEPSPDNPYTVLGLAVFDDDYAALANPEHEVIHIDLQPCASEYLDTLGPGIELDPGHRYYSESPVLWRGQRYQLVGLVPFASVGRNHVRADGVPARTREATIVLKPWD